MKHYFIPERVVNELASPFYPGAAVTTGEELEPLVALEFEADLLGLEGGKLTSTVTMRTLLRSQFVGERRSALAHAAFRFTVFRRSDPEPYQQ